MDSTITRKACPCCGSNAIGKVLTCKDYTVSGELFEIWQCQDCTLRFTQGVPTQEAIGPYYQSDTYISHSDTEKGLISKGYQLARKITLDWKLKLVEGYVGKGRKGSLLDIGAGTGAFLNRVKMAGWSVTGLEPDEGARRICQEKYGETLQTPEKLFELPGGKYDAVTMWHVLEHVHELHEYMTEIKRVLTKDGVALIALPNYTSLDAQHYGAYWAAYDVPRHLYHFAPKAFGKLVEQHALKLVATRPMWLDAFYISLLSEQYKNGKTRLTGAVWNGLRSNLHAAKDKLACSSLVYVVTHL